MIEMNIMHLFTDMKIMNLFIKNPTCFLNRHIISNHRYATIKYLQVYDNNEQFI